MFKTKNVNKAAESMDKFINQLDECTLIFKNGVKNYLEADRDNFSENLKSISSLENAATELRRDIETKLYVQSLMWDTRGDLLQLLERLYNIVRYLCRNLFQFEIEVPTIPVELNVDFIKLSEISSLAVESLVPAVKCYFNSPQLISEKIHRVYFYERETNKLAQSIKRKVFHDMNDLKLSQKFHLRYFALHIEEIAQGAEKAADLLSVMAVKLNY